MRWKFSPSKKRLGQYSNRPNILMVIWLYEKEPAFQKSRILMFRHIKEDDDKLIEKTEYLIRLLMFWKVLSNYVKLL
ncbi:unnamed protein product [Blepharisma stoltei]|uniref:Uncharacterized protein n=1 Tax=Blepharisma stoltei TaxID=1481888 RepID=A0AAU9INY7_9CILI|nr:unnamed protein product [Blepharisma stoltei]